MWTYRHPLVVTALTMPFNVDENLNTNLSESVDAPEAKCGRESLRSQLRDYGAVYLVKRDPPKDSGFRHQ